ncbi:hypothetical protein GCM10027290_46370 [Micromonospora sonneratiae]
MVEQGDGTIIVRDKIFDFKILTEGTRIHTIRCPPCSLVLWRHPSCPSPCPLQGTYASTADASAQLVSPWLSRLERLVRSPNPYRQRPRHHPLAKRTGAMR